MLVAILGAGVIASMAGCSNPTAAPTVSTIAVTSTAYVTIPARTTTSTIAAVESDAGVGDNNGERESSVADDPTQERVYEIKGGDYLVAIAADFDVPVNYLPEYNGWDDGLRHALVPGQEMRIPPSDWDPDGPAGPDASDDTSDGSAPDETAVAGCAGGEQPETYTIQAGDTPGRVAVANDVTVAELAAANQGVTGYAGFVVGIEITIPC